MVGNLAAELDFIDKDIIVFLVGDPSLSIFSQFLRIALFCKGSAVQLNSDNGRFFKPLRKQILIV